MRADPAIAVTVEPSAMTIAAASRRIASGDLSPVALTQAYLDRIARLDPVLDCYITVTAERALEDAATAEAEIEAGRSRGPLHGIPYALKDIFNTARICTTANAKPLVDNVPATDSTCARRLAEAGGVLLGKLTMHQFAFGEPVFDAPFPPARNPWHTAYGPGGSSSGSAAAVAADLAPAALGSDTAGSIRTPASFCGVVGLKPTYGLVSRHGVVPLSYSLDHCGPMTWTVEDAAIVLQAIAGYDPLDAASSTRATPDFAAAMGRGVDGMRVGLMRQYLDGASAEIVDAIDAAAGVLEDMGARIEDVTLPDYELFAACGMTLLLSEAYAAHAHDLKHRPQEYSRVTRERLTLGAYISATDYVQATRHRRRLAAAVNEALTQVDVLLTGAVPGSARRLERQPMAPVFNKPSFSIAFNVSGHPALAQCCGFAANGLPLGLQLVGRLFDEATLFRVAHAYECATPWRTRRPAIATSST